MADWTDEASDISQRFNEHALVAAIARARRHESQLTIDGAVCCKGCRIPISLERLAAMPGAARCVTCQSRQGF